jgi:hypothetical protein
LGEFHLGYTEKLGQIYPEPPRCEIVGKNKRKKKKKKEKENLNVSAHVE